MTNGTEGSTEEKKYALHNGGSVIITTEKSGSRATFLNSNGQSVMTRELKRKETEDFFECL